MAFAVGPTTTLPRLDRWPASASNMTANTLTGEIYGMVFQAPADMTISGWSFLTSTVTTGGNLDCRVETVGADGNPTGTLWAANTNQSLALAATDDNVIKTVSLTANATVARGQWVALVMVNDATCSWIARTPNPAGQPYSTSYGVRFSAAAWTQATTLRPSIAVNANGTFPMIEGLCPMITATPATVAISNATTPDELGNKLTFPYPVRVIGAYHRFTGTGDNDIVLYDANNNVLRSVSVDGNYGPAGFRMVYFATDYDAPANSALRIVVKPTSATTITLTRAIEQVSGAFNSIQGVSSSVACRTARTDAGAWTDTTTELIHMGLIVSAFDNGAYAVPT